MQRQRFSLLVTASFVVASFAQAYGEDSSPSHPDVLWIAQPTQLTAFALADGQVRWQLPVSETQWMATDPATGNVWAGNDDRFHVISPAGEVLAESTPSSNGGMKGAVIDGVRRVAWLNAGDFLVRFSADTFGKIDELDMASDAEAFALDESGGNLFVLSGDDVVRVDVVSGAMTALPLPDIGVLTALSFDRHAARLWIAGRHAILAVNCNGSTVVGPLSHGLHQPVHLAADGTGGAWLADNHELAHFAADGSLTAQLEPFSDTTGNGNGSRIRTVLDYDGAAWIHHNRLVRRVDASGGLGELFDVPGSSAALQTAVLHQDDTPPEITFVEPLPESFTNDSTPEIRVVYSDYGSSVARDSFEFSLDGNTLPVTCEADDVSALCRPLTPLADGHHTLAVTIADIAGNRSAPATVTFTVDAVPPALLEILPVDGLVTAEPLQTVTGRFSEPVTLSINGVAILSVPGEEFAHAVELAEGENLFNLAATDRAGNEAQFGVSYTFDSQPPVIVVTSPEDGFYTQNARINVQGTVDKPAAVSVNGSNVALNALAFSHEVDLVEGLNAISVEARSVAGKTAYETVHVTLDTTPPAPPGAITVVHTPNGIEIIGAPGAVGSFYDVEIILDNPALLPDTLTDWKVWNRWRRGRGLEPSVFHVVRRVTADANGAFSIAIEGGDFSFANLRIRTISPGGNVSDPMPLPEPQPDRRDHPVGRLAGEFSVDPTGAANYRIPIDVPKGAAGMQPDLALLYSSRAGNGHLGVGWSLSGLSAVTRCPQTIAQDGVVNGVDFEADDQFCLDGQRLVEHGTGVDTGPYIEYRTEIESFQKVARYGTNAHPAYFIVRDKAGLIRHYGSTEDSHVEVQGRTVPMMWAVSKIEDRFGNYIKYEYEENSGADGNGEHYPKEIAWYNNRDHRIGHVALEYENRPDASSGYLPGGGKTSLTKRLRKITVFAGGSTARSYSLSYEQSTLSGSSILTSAKLCNFKNACLPETRFGWLNPAEKSAAIAHLSGGNEYTLADIDGDGMADFVSYGNDQFRIRFAKDPERIIDTGVSNALTVIGASIAGDFDGDGLQDLLVPRHLVPYYKLLRSAGGSLEIADNEAIYNGAVFKDDIYRINASAVDINGDGKSEVLIVRDGRLDIVGYGDAGFEELADAGFEIARNQKVHIIQGNGDGIPDLYVARGDCPIGVEGIDDVVVADVCDARGVWLGTGTIDAAFIRSPLQPARVKFPVFIDANGDGLTDVLHKNPGNWRLQINTGAGWEETAWEGWGWEPERLRALDWNRDGKQDLMVAEPRGDWPSPYQDVWTVRVSNGAGFEEKRNSGFNDGSHGGRYRSGQFMDMTGDGVEDLFYHDGDNAWVMSRPASTAQPLLTGVIDGYGMETAVGYMPLSLLGDEYLGHTDAGLLPRDREKLNIRDFEGPLSVVRFFAQDTGRVLANGSHVKIATSYRYKGAKLDVHGRGFLGFAEVHASNANTGIDTVNHHKQSFPFAGVVWKSEQWLPPATSPPEDIDNGALRDRYLPGCPEQPLQATRLNCDFHPFTASAKVGYAETTEDGTLVSRTVSAFTERRLNASVLVTPSQTTESTFDIGSGELVRRVHTAFDYDDHGNATHVNVETDGGEGSGESHIVETINTYADDEERWLLGRLAASSVVHRSTESQPVIRHAAFIYHQESGQLVREILEPGNPYLQLQTDYTHDAFGNVQTRTVSSTATAEYAITPRTTVTQYDDNGVYPVLSRNALGHEETTTWDARFNAKTSSTGPNGPTSTWIYDAFGQLQDEISPRSALRTTTTRNWCGGGTACHHESAEIRVHTHSSAGGESFVELDRLGREVFAYSRGMDENPQGSAPSAIFIARETWYDLLGRPYLVSEPYKFSDPVVCYTFRSYDNLNRVTKEHRPANAEQCDRRANLDIRRLYDHKTSPATYTAITAYAYEGLAITITSPDAAGVSGTNARKVRRVENVVGQLSSITEWLDDDSAVQTQYTYTATGETATVTPPSGKPVAIEYDRRGRKTLMRDPDMGNWHYRHNALGELVWQQDAKGQVVAMEYDLLGRMTRRTEPEGEARWTYDTAPGAGIGKLASVEQHDGYRELFAYTAFGELDTALKVIDGFAYFTRTTYDNVGRVQNLIYPAARDIPAEDADIASPDTEGALTLTHHYDASGHLKRIHRTDNGQDTLYWQADEQSARGQLAQVTLGNGLANHARFDAATGLVIEQGVGPAGNGNYTRQFMSYAWDTAGNLLGRADQLHGVTETFQYDRLYRLAESRLTAGGISGARTFSYDAAGNLLHKGNLRNYQYGEGDNGKNRPHAVIGIDHYSGDTQVDTLTYLYDANGNAIDANGRAITWSSFNKPVHIEKGGAVSTFAYGPDRARYRHTRHYQNGDTETTHSAGLVERVEREIGGATTLEYRQHIVAGGQVIAIVTDYAASHVEQTRYLHRDHLGSVALITDNGGKTIEEHRFDAFGAATGIGTLAHNPWRIAPVANLVTPRGFTGHEMLDHLGLIHMNGRIYDPDIGRFLSADPFVQFPASTQGYNRYSYLNNNPLNATDPSGYFSWRRLGKELGNVTLQPWKDLRRWMFAQMSPQMASAVISIGSFFCGPAAPACAAAGTYDYQRAHGISREDAAKSAFAAAIATYAGQTAMGYADAGQYWKAFGTAYAGGYTSARVNGGDGRDGIRAGLTASAQLGLNVAMDKYAGSRSDFAQEGARVKSTGTGVRNVDASNMGSEITIDPMDPLAPRLLDMPLADLSQEQLAYLSQFNDGKIYQDASGTWAFRTDTEGSAFMNGFGRSVPRANAFSVFHDQWMFDWGNIQNSFVLAITIPPAVWLEYCAVGACMQYQTISPKD